MKVFISSTCYDLPDVRAVLEQYFEQRGHTPLLSDRNTFPVDAGLHRHRVCVEQARAADLFLLIVDARYGSPYVDDSSISITHAEFRAASTSVPWLGFVRRRAWDERNAWNKHPTMPLEYVTDSRLCDFLNEVQKQERGMWLTPFDTVIDIVDRLNAMNDERQRDVPAERRVLYGYYTKGETAVLPLSIRLQGERVTTEYYTRPEWLDLYYPVDNVDCSFDDSTSPPSVASDSVYGKRIKSLLALQGVRLWDDPCYRLLDYDVSRTGVRLAFGDSKYFRYRFSAGLMADE